MTVTEPSLGSPEPRKHVHHRQSAAGTEQDPQAVVETTIAKKSGPDMLSRVKQYLVQTGYPDPAAITQLSGGDALLYTYDLAVEDWKFTNTLPGVLIPELVDEKEIDNNSAATVTEQFSYSKTTTDTFTFSFTEGLKVGVSAKFKAGVPFAGTEWTVSGEFSFTGTQSQTTTNTATWTNTVTINVPAHTKVRAVAFVTVGSPIYSFSSSAVVTAGKVNIPVYDSAIGSWYDAIIPLAVLLPMPADRSLTLSGILSANCGVRTYVDLDPAE